MKITFTLKSGDLRERFVRPYSRRERLNSLLMYTSPLMFIAAVYEVYLDLSGSGTRLILLEGVAILYGIMILLWVTAWGLKVYAARTNHSTTYTVEISEAELLCQVLDEPVHRYPWTQLREAADWGDYFVFTSSKGHYLAVIPKSAFEDADQADTFFVQSRHYWEAAKNGATWPPAPRSSRPEGN